MAQSRDDANAPDNLDRESLPWQPSSAPLAAEDFSEGPNSAEEAIGGGSHRSREATAAARDRSARMRDALADAIVTQPLVAVGIAAALGFLAAALLRR